MRYGKTTPVWLVVAGFVLALIVSGPAANQQARSEYWANSVNHPFDPFANMPFGQPSWVKFTILTADPRVVYFQDSVQYPFHYDFAVAELPSFAGMTAVVPSWLLGIRCYVLAPPLPLDTHRSGRVDGS